MVVKYHPNEPSEIINKLKGEGVELIPDSELPFDYLVEVRDVKIPIERKQSDDYASSITDGRLFNQLYHMSSYSSLSILCIIGNITFALMDRKLKREAYVGSLASTVVKAAPNGGHVSIISLDTDYDFVMFVKYIYRKLVENDLIRLPSVNVKKSDYYGAKIAMLQCIPGIGEVNAKKLIQKYRSISNLVKASESELMTLIGVRGLKVYQFIHDDYIPSNT